MDAYFYYLICFILFVVIFYRPISKVLLSFLDEKITKIKWDLDSSLRKKEELLSELDLIRTSLEDMDKKHKVMISLAKEEIEESYQDSIKELNSALDFSKKNADARIAQMKKEALAKMKSELLRKSLDIVSSYFSDQKDSDLDIAIISSSKLKTKS